VEVRAGLPADPGAHRDLVRGFRALVEDIAGYSVCQASRAFYADMRSQNPGISVPFGVLYR
jgi:hypothetical protein